MISKIMHDYIEDLLAIAEVERDKCSVKDCGHCESIDQRIFAQSAAIFMEKNDEQNT